MSGDNAGNHPTIKSYIGTILRILENNGIELSQDVVMLAKTNFAMRHKGINEEEWAVASIYAAIRVSDCSAIPIRKFVELLNRDYEESNPRSYDDMSSSSVESALRYDVRYIAKCYNRILANQKKVPRPCNVQPTIYVQKYAEELYFPQRALGFASRLSEDIVKRKLHRGHSPNVVAAAIIHFTSGKFGLGLSKTEIASRACCTTVSISNAERFLAPRLREQIKDQIKL